MLIKYLNNLLPGKKQGLLFLLILSVIFLASSFKKQSPTSTNNFNNDSIDSAISKKAFLAVYDVLMSPRFMNCHPSGDVPLQGDDSKLHTQLVKRGKDGKGMYASKCANCHMDKNPPGLNMPPGNPNWHLPPENMKMIFQGKTARELAAQLLNAETNGNKSKQDLINHVTEDGLVLGGWNPGEGRKLPPLSHAEFVRQFKSWMDNGAYLPD